jgi:hypothetical protein
VASNMRAVVDPDSVHTTHLSCASTDSRASTTTTLLLHGQVLLDRDIAVYYSCIRAVRLAYQPPANNTFLSKQISHQQPASSINQHQPPDTSQTNRLILNRYDFYIGQCVSYIEAI